MKSGNYYIIGFNKSAKWIELGCIDAAKYDKLEHMKEEILINILDYIYGSIEDDDFVMAKKRKVIKTFGKKLNELVDQARKI